MKKWYAVIGDPIEQSKSPSMHDTWFAENEIDATYIPILVEKDELSNAVSNLRQLGCSGWNVTVPHKTAIIPFLDRLESSALQMNAVNTVQVMEDGTLVGSNTDGSGFVKSLEEAFGDRGKDGDILVIGAGGAARGIAHALLVSDYGKIFIANRTAEKATQLARELQGANALTLKSAEAALARFKLIIQTTVVGMNFAQQGSPINLDNLAENTIVADIIYNPLETQFLKSASLKGAQTMNGVGMFVHQGALAFSKWTNISPDTKKMKKQLHQLLEGQYVNR